MGNQASSPQQRTLLDAVDKGDLADVKMICQRVMEAKLNDPQGFETYMRQQIDVKGRTPLIIAAQRNFDKFIPMLLQLDVDPNYVNPRPLCNGSALHEAVVNNSFRCIEPLLQGGANPFLSNVGGRTPMEDAVLSQRTEMVRRFEALALFAGEIGVKWKTLFSKEYKIRHAVVMMHLPAPCQGQGLLATTAQKQLWLYTSRASKMPKCRLWLNGASISQGAGKEATLVLHPNHKEPMGDIYRKNMKNTGYQLFFHPARSTAKAQQEFEHFVKVCSSNGGELQEGSNAAFAALLSRSSSGTSQRSAATADSVSGVSHQQSPAHRNPGSSISTPGHPFAAAPNLAVPSHSGAGAGSVTSSSGSQLYAGISQTGYSNQQGTPRLEDMGALAWAAPAGLAPVAAPAATSSFYPPIPSYIAYASGDHAPSAPPLMNAFEALAIAQTSSQANAAVPTAYAVVTAIPKSAVGTKGAADMADDSTCVICLSAGREVGLLHGATVHYCVCKDCSKSVSAGQPCYLCRQPVERVLQVYQ